MDMQSHYFDLPKTYLQEIADTIIKDSDTAEKFRIKFLGSKNVLKEIFASIRDVPN